MAEPRKIGPFDVGEQLGVGGMGVVYLAIYRETGQKVALKILSPALSADKKLIRRFEREIDILKKLEHPNIVRYFGGGRHGDQRYYAMEYVDGGSLDTILERKGTLSWEQTVKIGLQLSSALEHAHNHGIIHRDLKPGNLFVSKKGRLRLGDFGIARDNDATALTAAGKTVGTYAYMAPEQIHGKHSIGPKTDLYSMGCLLYQFLTGTVPFTGSNAAEIFMKHLNDEPDSVCEHNLDCPIWLDKVIQKMLKKEPSERPYDALAVHTLLEDVRERVTKQTSMAQHAMTSNPVDTVATEKDRTELHKAIGKKKKKKKKKKGPIWERAWFLTLCLAGLIAGVTWLVWPPNEQELFDQISISMKNPDNWADLQRQEIASYRERFPEGPHVSDINEFEDQIEMDRAERRAEARARKDLKPKTEAEKLYMQARQYEDFGDRLTALEQYDSLINVFKDRPDDRAFVNLAKKRRREIQSSPPQARLEIVNSSLKKADQFVLQGRPVEARELWTSIVRLYRENREVERQVSYAQARLNGDDVPPFDFGDDQPPSGGSGQNP